jgi:molecular chaperone GrpE (heat shock protein)
MTVEPMLAGLVVLLAIAAGVGWGLWWTGRRRAVPLVAKIETPGVDTSLAGGDVAGGGHAEEPGVRDMAETLAQARAELDQTRLELADARRAARAAERTDEMAEPPPIVERLLAMYDRLSVRLDGADPTDRAESALGWVRDSVVDLLSRCDVVPVLVDGEIDEHRHQVVAILPAPSPDLADHVAETVRTGFLWRGEIIRPAQVTAYVDDANR